MNGFLLWFNSHTKMKRWIFLMLIGILLICYGISKIIVTDVIPSAFDIVKIALSFALGVTFAIVSIVHLQKRTMELLIENSDTRDETNNTNRLIFNKKVYNQGPKIVVIGGGSGLNTVLRGLKNYTDNITAIVTVSDYGETPTDSRKALKILPMDDISESLAALSYDEKEMTKLLNYKFEQSKLKDLKFSDIYFLAMNNIKKNFTKSIECSQSIFNITGKVLPVTLDAINICAELEDGSIVQSRDEIPEIVSKTGKRIGRIFISPTNTKAAPGVLEAIKEADAIVIGPGSLYTNVIPNLLVRGIAKQIKDSNAIKIYVSNIMTEQGQTDDYTLSDHIKAIQEYIGKDIIDYCIYDTGEIVPEFIHKYNLKGADVVLPDTQNCKALGVKLIQRNLSVIDGDSIRHDSDVIASTIIQLVCDELEFKDMENDSQYMMLSSKLIETKRERKRREKREKKFLKSGRKQFERKSPDIKSKFMSKYDDRMKSIKDSDTMSKDNKRLKVEKATEKELLEHVSKIGIGKEDKKKKK